MAKKKVDKAKEKKAAEASAESAEDSGLAVVGADADEGNYENKEIRKKILELLAQSENMTWDLSVVLQGVYAEDLYRGWGFDSFREYIEKELNMHMRWAQILVQLQEWFAKMPPNIQKWIRENGWTKARMLMGKMTVENAAEWRNKIAGKSVAEIKELMKAEREAAGGGGEGGGDGGEDTATSKNFKLFGPQRENVDRALEKAGEMSGSDKDGHNLDLICTDFLATNAGVDSVQDVLRKMEKTLGVRLVAYVEEDDSVVYGADLIRDLESKDAAEGDPGNAEYEEEDVEA